MTVNKFVNSCMMFSMKYIDTHCHVNFAVYTEDVHQVVDRMVKQETTGIVVGTQYDTSLRAVELAQQYAHLYAIVGLHPIHTSASFHDAEELGNEGDTFTSRGELFDSERYRALACSPKVVGIGECGLDYYRNTEDTKAIQIQAFEQQLQLAGLLNLPVMLHVRPSQKSYDAYHDVLEILRSYKKIYPHLRGQAHFFAGDIDIAQQFIDLDFYISFTGVITFAQEYDEVVKYIPHNRILSETDAPYVTPVPHRGERNEPVYVAEVVKKIAHLWGTSESYVAKCIQENAQKLYGLASS